MTILASVLRLLIFKELMQVVTDTHYLKLLEIMSRDIIIDRVIEKIKSRSDVGYKKYGVTLHEDNQPLDKWLTDIQEELMDAINYIEKAKDTLNKL
jgi:hypothetical protein